MILPRRRKRDTFLPWIQLLADGAVTFLCLHFAFWFRFVSQYFKNNVPSSNYPVYFATFNLIVLIVIFFLRFYHLYQPTRLLTAADETIRVFKAVAAGTLVLMAASFFIRGFSFSRTFLVITGFVIASGISLERYLMGIAVMWVDRIRGSRRSILVLGADANARKLVHFYRRNPRFSTEVAGFLDDSMPKGASVEGLSILGKIDELPNHLKPSRQIHEAVLAAQGLGNERVLKIIYQCEKEMVTFRWIADIFGLLASRMSVSHMGGVSLLSFTDSPLSDWENRFLKRSMDILVSSVSLMALAPFLLVIAAGIKWDSKGPVFYRQRRIGEDGRKFTLLKFRTMRTDAEARTGPVWAKENDARRTRFGATLRKSNLDELPQLWNVLAGDMSLVGPRPERPFFVSQFKKDIPRYMARHSIRSGITGWAQVNGLRGNTSIEERTKFDLYYIENWSLLLDIRILFMTLVKMFSSPNAY